MATRGRKPKPTVLKLVAGNPGKRPINQDHVEEAILAIKQTIQQHGERDIPSQKVGELVMNQLSQMDEVAFVRFASVYHSFNDVSEFTQTIARLTQPKSNHAD